MMGSYMVFWCFVSVFRCLVMSLKILYYKLSRVSKTPNIESVFCFTLVLFIKASEYFFVIHSRSKPLLLVHGNQREAKAELEREAKPYPNVKLFGVSCLQVTEELCILWFNFFFSLKFFKPVQF